MPSLRFSFMTTPVLVDDSVEARFYRHGDAPVTSSLVAVAGRAVTLPIVRPSIASNRHFQSPPVPARLCVSRGAGFF